MWLDNVDNARSLLDLYGFEPSISDIYLLEVKLHEDGPQLSLRFNLKEYPQNPPSDWVNKKYNTVQVTLVLGGLHSISIKDFAKENHVKIALTWNGRRFALFVSGNTSIETEADIAFIPRVSAYMRDPPLRPAPAN